MLSSSLMFVVVGFSVAAFISASRYQRRLELRTEMETDCLKAIRLLSADLSETSFKAINSDSAYSLSETSDGHRWVDSGGAGPEGVTFPLPRDMQNRLTADGPGRMIWSKLVCYRVATLDGEPWLVKQEEPLAAPGGEPPVPYSMSPARSVSGYWPSLGAGRRLARGAVQMTAWKQSTIDSSTGSVRLGLKIRREADGHAYSFAVQTAVYPRNK